MGRPAKTIDTQSGNITESEKNIRRETEKALMGEVGEISPTFEISEQQRKIFDFIADAFKKAGQLGRLDSYILTEAAIVIDRLQEIEYQINADPEKLFDRDVCNTRKEYTNNFFRICNELSLSPQSRAKMGILAVNKDKQDEDPILGIFGDKKS